MDPFSPFAGYPGDPMEQVLALQTYHTTTGVGGECKSAVSCDSNASCISANSGDGGSSSSDEAASGFEGFQSPTAIRG